MTLPEGSRVDRGSAAANKPFYRDPLALFIIAASFALYLLSMPKTVALEDDSIFILAGYFNGISHPPGYPLYTLLLHLFTQVPLGDIPARAHASSAFFAALACCVLFYIFCHAGVERRISALATLVFAVTATFWSQAIVTEVYSLNVLLNLCLLLVALRIHRDFGESRGGSTSSTLDFLQFSILLGLAVANHWPLTVLAAPAYLLLIAGAFFSFAKKWVALLPGVAVALALYAWLYYNNQSSPSINFSGKFAGFREFTDYVLRSHYASVDFQGTAGWSDKIQFAGDLLLQIMRELNILLALAALGIYQLFRSPGTRLIGLAIAWAFFSNSLLLVLLIDFDYGQLYSLVFKVYPIVSIAMLFVLAGYAMASLMAVQEARIDYRHVAVVLVVALLLNLFFSLPQNYRHHYSWGEEYAQRILENVPANATLFADGEVELGQLAYHQLIKGQRPDIELYSSSALLLENRLFDYRLEDKKKFIEALVQESPQRLFYVANNYYAAETLSGNIYVDKLGKSESRPQRSVTSLDIEQLMRWSEGRDSRDPWTRIAIAQLRQKAIAIMVPVLKQSSDIALQEFVSKAIDNLVQSRADALHFLQYLMRDESEIITGFYQERLAAIDRGSLTSKQDDSLYVYLDARAQQALQSHEHVEQARRLACQNWPSVKNLHCNSRPGSQ